MFSPSKIVFVFSLIMIFVSCGNEEDNSPYAAIYSQPAFAGLTDSISRDRSNDDLYFRRAVLLNKNNFPEPALEDFKKAWNLRKDERYAIAISSLYLEDHPDSAILFLEKQGLKELPVSLLLQLNLAHAYEAINNLNKALGICDNILHQFPQQVDVLKLQSDLLEKKGDARGSILILEKAYQLTPFDIELNYLLALRLAEMKDPKLLTLCDSLIRVDSMGTHAEPNYYKGIYYVNLGDRSKAISEFSLALEKDYYFLDAYIEKAAAQYELKKFNEALKTLQLLLTISPKNADGYYWAGKCLEAMGDKEQANLNYQKALGLDKSMKEAKEGLERTRG